MKKKKIAFVLRTVGLEFDDRIRKECVSLSNKYEVTIFANFSDNRKEEGVTSYGVKYKSIKLNSRDIFPSSKFLLIKVLEFFLKTRINLIGFDLIWLHEEYTFLFALLLGKEKFIWDLHEIPSRFETGVMKFIFHYIEKKSIKLIHANQHRINYLIERGVIKLNHKHSFIRNFPDSVFVDSAKSDYRDQKFIDWLDNSPYVYLQGLTTPKRCALESIESIFLTEGVKAIVVGKVHSDSVCILRERYGSKLDERIYFIGMLDQLLIPYYLKNAKFSLILYDYSAPNNIFCEPNRLYQAIALQVPIIVGCNKPMKEIVDKFQSGISLNSDGTNILEVTAAIDKILCNYDFYKGHAKKFSSEILWNNQDIANIMSKVEGMQG